MRIARSDARSFSIEASTPKSAAPPSTMRATCHSHASHIEIGRHVGEHELDALELDDLLPGLPALVDVADRILERGARDAERMRRDAGARAVERGEQYFQAFARLAQQIGT